jgi:hypothetical protein
MDTNMDVIIGSFAVGKRLQFTQNTTKPIKDIDIITNTNKENKIVKIKRDKSIYYSPKKEEIIEDYITDYIQFKTGSSDELIYNWCNQNKDKCIKTEYGLIPPTDILYIIYLSHIHRIIPYASLKENIKIWENHYSKYINLREKVGYEIDKILYNSNQNNQNNHLNKIFHMRFNESNQKYRDTDIDMDKSENEFFKDNVERYFDHDFIHAQVALMLRGEESLLFSKFQKEGTVALDEDKFTKADNNLKIKMFQEEITVLFLERYIIPTLINNYKIPQKKFTGFEEKFMKFKLKELSLHLILNLSGKDHYFLRRYGINHYRKIMDYNSFNIEQIVNLALSLTKIERHIEDIVIDFNCMNDVEVFLDKIILNHIEKSKQYRKILIESNKNENILISEIEKEKNLPMFKDDKIFNKIVNYMKKYEKEIYTENNIYYGPITNIGVYSTNFINSIPNESYFATEKSTDIYVIFTIKDIKSNSTLKKIKEIDVRYEAVEKIYSILANTQIEIEYMSINEVNNKFSLKAIQNGIMTYYKSSSCSFGDQDITAQDFGYMNTYGDVPQCFHKLLENTFKRFLSNEINNSNAGNYEEFHERNSDEDEWEYHNED